MATFCCIVLQSYREWTTDKKVEYHLLFDLPKFRVNRPYAKYCVLHPEINKTCEVFGRTDEPYTLKNVATEIVIIQFTVDNPLLRRWKEWSPES